MTKTMPISIDYCIEMARMVWENRDNGTHAWIDLPDETCITIEPTGADDEDVLDIILTDSTDVMGYPMNVQRIAWIYAEDIDDDETLRKIFGFIMEGYEENEKACNLE